MSSPDSQRATSNYVLYQDSFGNQIFHFKEPEIILKIRKNGYIPKSGVFMAECLSQYNIRGNVLDIGTGETGFLAYYLKARGADNVVACDIDKIALDWAEQAEFNRLPVSWVLSDVFDSIENGEKFDLIVSNPPQMPMPVPGDPHDYGGYNGRDIIVKIIKGCRERLKENGRLILLCFDFLGVLERLDSIPSLAEVIEVEGLRYSIIGECEREVRKGGKTEENVDWISKVYPKYQFQKNRQGNLQYKMIVLEVSK